jgi:hypothetical protein
LHQFITSCIHHTLLPYLQAALKATETKEEREAQYKNGNEREERLTKENKEREDRREKENNEREARREKVHQEQLKMQQDSIGELLRVNTHKALYAPQ